MDFTMYDKLLQLPLFQGLGKNDFTQILEKVKFHFHKYSPGMILIREEEACDKLIFILDGEIQAETYDTTQKYILQETFKSPHVIEPYSLFGMKPYFSATYSAATEINVLTIGKKYVLEQLNNYDIFALNYLNMLSNRVQTLNLRLWNTHIGTTYEKIVNFLQMRCVNPDGPKMLLARMEDLAFLLNDTRINVSNALNEMQTQGLLQLNRKKIYIHNLRDLTESCNNPKNKNDNDETDRQ